MASEWDEALLEDAAEELTVGFVGPMASQYVTKGIPFLRSLNIEPLRVKTADMKYISSDFHAQLKKSALAPGNVVIVRTGKPGACAVIPEWLPVANCSDVVIVRCSQNLNPHFLAYYVNAVAHHHVSAHLVGAVQQHFNVGAARKIKIPLPPRPVQEQVISALRAIDQRIDLLNEQNTVLESTARAIFKSWFVDFDPVRAKAEGREPEGMDTATAALFPREFQDSDPGKVPQGWKTTAFDKVVTVLGGGTPKTTRPDFWGGDIPWFSIVDAPQASEVFVVNTEKSITKAGLENCSAKLLPVGATIISARGTVGKLAIVGVPMAINQSCYALLPDRMGTYGTYFQTARLVSVLQQRSHGAVFSTITRDTLSSVSSVVPPSSIANAFEAQVTPFMERILLGRKTGKALVELRDTLLPRLISGKLRVPDAEKPVEAVL